MSSTAKKHQRSVSDNGVGIPRENLTRIFAHGPATSSDGLGHGPTFSLELPIKK